MAMWWNTFVKSRNKNNPINRYHCLYSVLVDWLTEWQSVVVFWPNSIRHARLCVHNGMWARVNLTISRLWCEKKLLLWRNANVNASTNTHDDYDDHAMIERIKPILRVKLTLYVTFFPMILVQNVACVVSSWTGPFTSMHDGQANILFIHTHTHTHYLRWCY